MNNTNNMIRTFMGADGTTYELRQVRPDPDPVWFLFSLNDGGEELVMSFIMDLFADYVCDGLQDGSLEITREFIEANDAGIVLGRLEDEEEDEDEEDEEKDEYELNPYDYIEDTEELEAELKAYKRDELTEMWNKLTPKLIERNGFGRLKKAEMIDSIVTAVTVYGNVLESGNLEILD